MTEIGGGLYKAIWTPATVGFFRIEISSIVNKDFAAEGYK